VIREIHRILKPDGVLFLQLWPFYHSERGSHLWDWFPEGFHHLGADEDEIVAAMFARPDLDREHAAYMAGEFRTLNRVTVDALGDHLTYSGFSVVALQLLAHRVRLRPGLSAQYPLSVLGTAGIKLLAVPAH
jgi:SAM-dependent methyltransferase